MTSETECCYTLMFLKVFLMILLIQDPKQINCQNSTGPNETTVSNPTVATTTNVTMFTVATSTVAIGTTATTMCGSLTCLHGGTCKIDSNGNNRCQCRSEFEGLRCQRVKLKALEFVINSTSVTFLWNTPPRLEGYRFVYALKYDANSPLAYQNITMDENDHGATLAGLVSGAITYITCVIEPEITINASNPIEKFTIVNNDRSNCFSFRTSYDGNDPFTKAAIGVAISMGGLILVLVILRWGVDCGRKVTKDIKTLGFERAASQWIHQLSDKDENNPTQNVEEAIDGVDKQIVNNAHANPQTPGETGAVVGSVASSAGHKFTRGMKKKYAELAMSDLPIGDLNRGHKPGGLRHTHDRNILTPDP